MEVKKRRVLEWGGYFFLFFVVAGLSMAATVAILLRSGESTHVPKFLGRNLEESRAIAKAMSLDVYVKSRLHSADVSKDHVIAQSMSPNEKVRIGRSIGLVLSLGPRERVVPHVVGQSGDAADRILQSSGFTMRVTAISCMDGSLKGTVLSQYPSAGHASPHSVLEILLSRGPCRSSFLLPDFQGQELDYVVKTLSDSGVNSYSITYETNLGWSEGVVLRTSPSKGSEIQSDQSIRIIASTAQRQIRQAEPAATTSRYRYFRVPAAPGLFSQEAKLWVQRPGYELTYVIDFLVSPRKNASFALPLPNGSRLKLEIEGKEVWDRYY